MVFRQRGRGCMAYNCYMIVQRLLLTLVNAEHSCFQFNYHLFQFSLVLYRYLILVSIYPLYIYLQNHNLSPHPLPLHHQIINLPPYLPLSHSRLQYFSTPSLSTLWIKFEYFIFFIIFVNNTTNFFAILFYCVSSLIFIFSSRSKPLNPFNAPPPSHG